MRNINSYAVSEKGRAEMSRMLAQKMDRDYPNWLCHQPEIDSEEHTRMQDFISAYFYANSDPAQGITFTLLARAIVAGVNAGAWKYRPLNALAQAEFTELRKAALKRISSDAIVEVDALERATQAVEAIEEAAKAAETKPVAIDPDQLLIDEYRTGDTATLKKKLKSNSALMQRFEKLSAEGRLTL